jgi:hypothetical protein
MAMKTAIVIPFNPHLDFLGGSAVGSLIAHKWFADKHGSVFWDLIHAAPHPEIKTAYFYDKEEKAVTFKSKIQYMKIKEYVKENDEKFIPNWRMISWGRKQDPGQIWLKLRDMHPLKRKHRLSDFAKTDGSKLERVQNYAIVVDTNLKASDEKITSDAMIDDYIYRLTSQTGERLKEKNIEEIFWYFMLEKNLNFVDRQRGKDHRIDVAFKDNEGNYIIIEIKRGTADIDTLDQIKTYMKEIIKKEEAEKVIGIILCRKANLDLEEAVKEEENIFIDKYRFLISFPKLEEKLN